ncbi:hypothetical protein MKX03_005051 [Papaver bracteatum]|nr:hypothetical protein MKX03_005051 [Papaver bracteatum]
MIYIAEITLKTKRKPRDIAKTPDLISQVEDEDVPDFPRGGGSTLSKQKNNTAEDDDLGSLFGDGIAGKSPGFANRITLKKRKRDKSMETSSLRRAKKMSDCSGIMLNQDPGVDTDSDGSQTLQGNYIPGNLSVDEDFTNEYPVNVGAESGASSLPLKITLDDIDDSREDPKAEKNKRPVKNKAKEERSSPNSSFVWIKYMAFLIFLSDIGKARSIAERALRTINTREESEKLNVWEAYINLENEYGNPREEAVTKSFQRALQYCDPKKIHLALVGMYERIGQHKLANDLLEQMSKKFKHSCKVWLTRVQNILKQGKDGVQEIVKHALLCIPLHKHVKFISQSAILEFKCGVLDRGRSMFEGMLREYPKRTDLWNVYLDQMLIYKVLICFNFITNQTGDSTWGCGSDPCIV